MSVQTLLKLTSLVPNTGSHIQSLFWANWPIVKVGVVSKSYKNYFSITQEVISDIYVCQFKKKKIPKGKLGHLEINSNIYYVHNPSTIP